MSILYLIDSQTSPVTDSTILEVAFSSNTIDFTGGFVVRVADELNFDPDNIDDVSDIVTAKYGALLSFYPGFGNIVFDDLLDAAGIDAATASGCAIGGRNSFFVFNSGQVDTVAVALGGTPSQAIVTWETFELGSGSSNDKTGRARLEYSEALASDITVDASFNNGSTFNTVTDGGLFNIPAPDQGSNLILRFSNSGNGRGISSWAVIY